MTKTNKAITNSKTAAKAKHKPTSTRKPTVTATKASPKPAPQPVMKVMPAPPPLAPSPITPEVGGKLGILVGLLRQPDGASIYDLADAIGWQLHSVRGALAGALKKRGFIVISDKPADVRIYRLEPAKPRRGKAKKAG